jgi:hypothetical protein
MNAAPFPYPTNPNFEARKRALEFAYSILEGTGATPEQHLVAAETFLAFLLKD